MHFGRVVLLFLSGDANAHHIDADTEKAHVWHTMHFKHSCEKYTDLCIYLIQTEMQILLSTVALSSSTHYFLYLWSARLSYVMLHIGGTLHARDLIFFCLVAEIVQFQ